MDKVVLLRGENIFEETLKALEKAGFYKIDTDRVLVKPNLTANLPPWKGVTTDVRVVEAVLHALHEIGVKDIVIGESAVSAPATNSFRDNSYQEVVERYNARLIDLHEDRKVLVDVPNPLSIKRVLVAKEAYERFRVSVAKLKVHTLAGVSLSLKNMMGVLANERWKLIVHADVDRRIPDLNQVVKPGFAVIDGFVANEYDEVEANPVPMGIVLAGADPVAVDTVGALCIGYRDIPHIVNSAKVGLGVADINRIVIEGEKLENVARKLRTKRVYRNITGKIMGTVLTYIERIRGRGLRLVDFHSYL